MRQVFIVLALVVTLAFGRVCRGGNYNDAGRSGRYDGARGGIPNPSQPFTPEPSIVAATAHPDVHYGAVNVFGVENAEAINTAVHTTAHQATNAATVGGAGHRAPATRVAQRAPGHHISRRAGVVEVEAPEATTAQTQQLQQLAKKSTKPQLQNSGLPRFIFSLFMRKFQGTPEPSKPFTPKPSSVATTAHPDVHYGVVNVFGVENAEATNAAVNTTANQTTHAATVGGAGHRAPGHHISRRAGVVEAEAPEVTTAQTQQIQQLSKTSAKPQLQNFGLPMFIISWFMRKYQGAPEPSKAKPLTPKPSSVATTAHPDVHYGAVNAFGVENAEATNAAVNTTVNQTTHAATVGGAGHRAPGHHISPRAGVVEAEAPEVTTAQTQQIQQLSKTAAKPQLQNFELPMFIISWFMRKFQGTPEPSKPSVATTAHPDVHYGAVNALGVENAESTNAAVHTTAHQATNAATVGGAGHRAPGHHISRRAGVVEAETPEATTAQTQQLQKLSKTSAKPQLQNSGLPKFIFSWFMLDYFV